jgi:hypothetical protein
MVHRACGSAAIGLNQNSENISAYPVLDRAVDVEIVEQDQLLVSCGRFGQLENRFHTFDTFDWWCSDENRGRGATIHTWAAG